MAFQVLGHAYGNAGENSRHRINTRKAFALIDRVSERERLAIAATYHDESDRRRGQDGRCVSVVRANLPAHFHPLDLPRSFLLLHGGIRESRAGFRGSRPVGPSWLDPLRKPDGAPMRPSTGSTRPALSGSRRSRKNSMLQDSTRSFSESRSCRGMKPPPGSRSNGSRATPTRTRASTSRPRKRLCWGSAARRPNS